MSNTTQIAKDVGLRTITVMAERPEDDLTAQCVLSLGGDMVMHDTYLHTKVNILKGEEMRVHGFNAGRVNTPLYDGVM